MSDNVKKKSDYKAINENRVRLIGRVAKAPEKKGRYTRVPMLIPSRRGDGDTQWVPIHVDVIDAAAQKKVAGLTHGDYFKCSCFLVPMDVKDDEGNAKSMLMLQLDDYEPVGSFSGEMDELSPDDDGMCANEVLLVGRYILPKWQKDKGLTGPELRGEDKKKFTFVKIVYNNPRLSAEERESDKGLWVEVPLFGMQAEIACEKLAHMDQVLVYGELTKREANFLVKGRKPKETRISVKPYGFQIGPSGFGGGSGQGGGRGKEPSGPDTSVYDGDGAVEEDMDF
jgi:single-stranded DNA-binding protein